MSDFRTAVVHFLQTWRENQLSTPNRIFTLTQSDRDAAESSGKSFQEWIEDEITAAELIASAKAYFIFVNDEGAASPSHVSVTANTKIILGGSDPNSLVKDARWFTD